MSGLPCPESQQVSGVDEGRYAALMEPRRRIWAARAANEALGLSVREYAQRRAGALGRPYSRRLEGCNQHGVVVKCGCKGKREVRWYGCRQHLTCRRCQVSRAKRLGERVRAGLEASSAAAARDRRLVLLTLTVRHSGDVAVDRAAIAAGWRGLYKALHRRGWGSFPYVGTWEVTAGADGKGHVHAHVAVLWPFRDWSVVRELWLDACPESERITFVARRRDGRPSNPRSVAKYLGKYISKGVETADFSPELRADILAASYQTRWLFSSVGFWIPWVPVCPGCNLPRVRAQYRWHGEPFRIADVCLDGNPQACLPLAEPYQRAGPGCA